MKIESQKVEIILPPSYDKVLMQLELCARNCYQSECKDDLLEKEAFIKTLIELGHMSILEHCSFTFRITTSRGIANQIVRHRTGKYTQESTRYCNYAKDKFEGVSFIEPSSCSSRLKHAEIEHFKKCEKTYLELLEIGMKPEFARNVLPLATKTTLIATFDGRNLRNFLEQRLSKEAHPDIKEIANYIKSIMTRDYKVLMHNLKVVE